MPKVSSETSYFVNQLDAAVDAHMGWVRRVLRCAVLGTSPGDDVLDPMAHALCHFGRWFALNKPKFEKLDAEKAHRLDTVHKNMHDAVRAICKDLLARRGGESADLDVFEQTQSELMNLLAEFKQQVMAYLAEPLPWALTWSDQLSVNIPVIDIEHQRCIQLCNKLVEAITQKKSLPEIQKCMQALVDDTGGHFFHEESLLREWGYPETDEHVRKHEQALIELSGIMGSIRDESESEWVEAGLKIRKLLIEHILNEDMKYRDYCQQKDVKFPD